MNKVIQTILLAVTMTLTTLEVKAQVIKYTSTDSINGKPKLEAALKGRIKLNAIYDIKGNLHGNSAFLIHKNGIDANNKPGLWVDLRQSQIRFDGTQRLKNGKEIFARIEGDFEGGPDNRSIFRLRHAFIQYANLTVGQTWSTFGDNDLWPASLLDWDGPTGMARSRRPLIRYNINYSSHFQSEIAAEIMEPRRLFDYTTPDNTISYEPRRLPDFVGTLKYKFTQGFIKVAGIYRHIDYGYVNEHKVANGYGISTMLNFFPIQNTKNQFILQYNYGKGIADYLLPIGGSKLDGNVSNKDITKLNLLPTMSGFISYQQFWKSKIHSLFLASFSNFDSKKTAFDWDKMQNIYLGTNLMFDVLPNLSTGAEFLWGRKTLRYETTNKHSIASRINFGFLYNF